MIIQTGQRTDIPAFYTPWFLNRLREGFVLVRNPFHYEAVTRYRLSPDVVDLVGLCTKNPAPMLPHLSALAPYGQYWYVTITPYGTDLEPHVPPAETVMASFQALSRAVGKNRVGWRYDPIVLTERYTVDFHLAAFARMADRLAGYTETVVISFIDLYEKVRVNFPEARPVPRDDRLRLGEAFVRMARERGFTLYPCGEGDELAVFGADCSGCMTVSFLERALGQRLRVPASARRQNRDVCACLISGDIGAYDTCGHLCRYCYANVSKERVAFNLRHHDPASPLLVGHLENGDTVHEARQESWLDPQLSFL